METKVTKREVERGGSTCGKVQRIVWWLVQRIEETTK